MPRRLDLCADDFGLTPGLSQVVASLAGRGRVSSLSCLVNGAHWVGCAPLLAPLAGRIGVGMHFNLTEGAPLSEALARRWPRLPALPRLIVAAQLRRLPLADIGAEWRAQLAAFVAAAGRLPDHVDGHQHVHHLPGVRDIVLAGVAARRAQHRPRARARLRRQASAHRSHRRARAGAAAGARRPAA